MNNPQSVAVSGSYAYVTNVAGNSLTIFNTSFTAINVSGSMVLTGSSTIQGYSDGFISTIYNQSTDSVAGSPSTSSDGLLIQLGTLNANRTTGNTFIGFADSTGTLAGAIVGGASSVAYDTTGADYSEYFLASNLSNLPTAGQLVSLSGSNNTVTQSNGAIPIGIVSTNPGFIGNGPLCKTSDNMCQANYAKTNVIVALTGQVPAVVSVANGNITPGDPITSSTTPGVGELATAAGYIVGYALSGTSSNGTIQVLVEPGYYNPLSATNMQGSNAIVNSLRVNGAIDGQTLNISGVATFSSLAVVNSASINSNLSVGGALTVAGATTVNDLTINGHIITSGNSPIISVLPASGTNAIAAIIGNDTSGTINITMGAQTTINGKLSGTNPTSGDLASLVFAKAFGTTPHILITPNNSASAKLLTYPDNQSVSGFSLGVIGNPVPQATYQFEYLVVQ
jgi:hypothetical protein